MKILIMPQEIKCLLIGQPLQAYSSFLRMNSFYIHNFFKSETILAKHMYNKGQMLVDSIFLAWF